MAFKIKAPKKKPMKEENLYSEKSKSSFEENADLGEEGDLKL